MYNRDGTLRKGRITEPVELNLPTDPPIVGRFVVVDLNLASVLEDPEKRRVFFEYDAADRFAQVYGGCIYDLALKEVADDYSYKARTPGEPI